MAESALREGELRDYVRTPGGLVHQECLYRVPENAHIRSAGNETWIENSAGEFVMAVPPCEHPRPPAPFNPLPGGTLSIGYAGIHLATAQQNGGRDWYNGFSGEWTVPDVPTNFDSDTLIYIFNGLEPLDAASIVQPVLQFGRSPAGGGSYWSLGAWYVDQFNNAMFSGLSPIGVGETVTGWAYASSCAPDGDCEWQIGIRGPDFFTYQGLNVSADNYVMRLAFAGALEIYGVDTCDQLPATGVTFRNTQFLQPGMNWMMDPATSGVPWDYYTNLGATQTWTPLVDTTGTPACNYAITPTADGATFSWTSS